MQPDTMRTSRVVALALVVGIFFVTQEVLTDLAGGKPVSVVSDITVVLVFWVVWAFLTPAVLVAVRCWPLATRPVYLPLVIHAGVAAFLAAAQALITVGLRSVVMYLRGAI